MTGGWWSVVGDGPTGGDAASAASRQPPAASRQPPAASHQPPATNHQPPMTHRRLSPGGWGGRGAAGPRPVRCVVTVSTKQTCPARPLSTRPPVGGPAFVPCRITAMGIAVHDAGRTWRPLTPAVRREARGEQAQAIHRPPQGPPDSPPPGPHRSTTARRRQALDPTPSPPTGWRYYAGGFGACAKTGVLNSQGVERAGCFFANPTMNPGAASRIPLPLREKVAERSEVG